MSYFPDFSRSAALGFSQGREMAEGTNPLGNFVKMMLANKENILSQQRDIAGKVQVEQAKAGIEQASPLYKAQTKAYETLGTQRTAGLIDEKIKEDAWNKYQAGDKSPEVLKALGMFVSPMEALIAQNMGLGGSNSINLIPTSPTEIPPVPKSLKYNSKKEKPQYNPKTGEWRIVPLK